MPLTFPRRSLLGTAFSAVLLGALASTATDSSTLAVGLGLVLLLGVTVTTALAAVTLSASSTPVHGASRLRRQWGRMPIPQLDPGLAGRPQPRAPGGLRAEVRALGPACP